MQVKVEKQPKSTIKLTVNVPVEDVKKSYEQVLTEYVKNAELPGFRKGMAPKEMVEEKSDVSKLYGEVINEILQKYYSQAIKENHISPVSNPRVEIKEFDLNKEFEFTALVPTKPEIKIGNYMKELKSKQEEIEKNAKKLNEENLKKGESIEDSHMHLSMNDVIEAINKVSDVEIPDLLIEDETERMMARLVNQAESIGLSLSQYLKAQNKTEEELKKDYNKIAENTLKSEFVLSELAKDRNVEISEDEIKEVALASGDPQAEERLNNPIEKWYIKSILEKNKMLSELIEEVAHGHQ